MSFIDYSNFRLINARGHPPKQIKVWSSSDTASTPSLSEYDPKQRLGNGTFSAEMCPSQNATNLIARIVERLDRNLNHARRYSCLEKELTKYEKEELKRSISELNELSKLL